MTATIFTPDGIVISTYAYDTFYQASKRGEEDYIEKISIVGHPHIINFWNQYALVFHQTDEFLYNAGLKSMIEEVKRKWSDDDIPAIYDLMPYVKKQIMDIGIQIIGIMGGYSRTKEGSFDPHVYQILGNDIRRININNSGEITYNCVFLEKETVFGRILRDVQVKNGDNWESLPPMRLRCDLFSITKAKELTSFILKTNHVINTINQSTSDTIDLETVVITPTYLNIE